jgi:hypothetical protein
MPLRAHHRPPRSTAPDRSTQTVSDIPFDDLVSLLATGVADAQTALDRQTAETAASLAETEIEVVPSLTRTIEPDGTVTTDTAATERRSLLELGVTPAHYRFSDATIEVEMDVSVAERDRSENGRSDTERAESERADRAHELRAGTQSVIDRRTFDREAGANARLAARLEPTPTPAAVGPDATGEALDAVDGGERAD